MVDEDEAKAVDMEMVDVVMVMVIEVIMKLTVVIEMMLNKEFDVEVDKEVAKEVFIRARPKNEKRPNRQITANLTGSVHKKARKKKFGPKKVDFNEGDCI